LGRIWHRPVAGPARDRPGAGFESPALHKHSSGVQRLHKPFSCRQVNGLTLNNTKMFSLLEIGFHGDDWYGFSIATFGASDAKSKSLLQIARAFDGTWFIDVLWIKLLPR